METWINANGWLSNAISTNISWFFSYFFLPALPATSCWFLLLYTIRSGLYTISFFFFFLQSNFWWSLYEIQLNDKTLWAMKISSKGRIHWQWRFQGFVLLLFCTTSMFFLTLSGKTKSGHCNQFQKLNRAVSHNVEQLLFFSKVISNGNNLWCVCIRNRKNITLVFPFTNNNIFFCPANHLTFFRFSCCNFFLISLSIFSKCSRDICPFFKRNLVKATKL